MRNLHGHRRHRGRGPERDGDAAAPRHHALGRKDRPGRLSLRRAGAGRRRGGEHTVSRRAGASERPVPHLAHLPQWATRGPDRKPGAPRRYGRLRTGLHAVRRVGDFPGRSPDSSYQALPGRRARQGPVEPDRPERQNAGGGARGPVRAACGQQRGRAQHPAANGPVRDRDGRAVPGRRC